MALTRPRRDTSEIDDGRVAFAELWAEREALERYCRRMVSDPALADDMVQEAYTEAFLKLDELHRESSLLPWLATVAKRRGINFLRGYRYATPVEALPEDPCPDGDPADVAEARDRMARVHDALAGLTERERLLLARQVHDGLSIAELAAQEESSPASVRSVLQRARAKLRAAVDGTAARALAPVLGLGGWVRRRVESASLRAQESGPAISTSAGSLGNAVTAAVISITISAVPAVGESLDGDGDTVETASERVMNLPPTERAGIAHERPDPPLEVRPLVVAATADEPAPAPPTGEPAPEPPPDEPDSPLPDAPLPDGDDPLPDPPPAPEPPPPPADPENPTNDEEAEEPEDGRFHDVAVAGSGGASTAGASSDDGQHVFALGVNELACATPPCTILFHSADGARSWEKLAGTGLEDARQILVPRGYSAGDPLYAVGPESLLRSEDGGRSFEPVEEAGVAGPATMSPRFSEGDQRIFIGQGQGWVYDAGEGSLSPFTGAPLPSAISRFELADGPDGMVTFAATTVKGPLGVQEAIVYRCTDGECDEGTILEGVREVPRLAASSRFADDGIVFAWGRGGVYRSDDHGLTWEPVELPAGGPVTSVSHDGSESFYVSMDESTDAAGGLFVWDAAGDEWRQVPQRAWLRDGIATVAALEPGRVLASPNGEDHHGVFCTADGGASWHRHCPAGDR